MMDSVEGNTSLSANPDSVFQSVPLKEHINLDDIRNERPATFEIDEDRARQLVNDIDEDDERRLYEKYTPSFDLRDYAENPSDTADLTQDGGVKKRVLRQGMGKLPSKGNMVKVHYAAYVEELDEPYDDTRLRGKPCFVYISKEDTPQKVSTIFGLYLGLKTMQKLEMSEFIISHEYAYGDLGCPPRIPKKATVRFIVELLDILEDDAMTGDGDGGEEGDNFVDLNHLSTDLVIKKVDTIRQLCKSLLEEQNPRYIQAWRQYKYALGLLEKCSGANKREEVLLEEYLQIIYVNVALCLYKQSKYRGSASAAAQAVKINTSNGKAHYWLAKSNLALNNLAIAKRHLLRAKDLNPNSSDIQKAFKDLEISQRDATSVEKDMCSKMFSFKQPADSANNSSRGARPKKTVAQQIIDDDKHVREVQNDDSNVEGLIKKVSPEFQTMIVEKLSAFQSDNTQTTLTLPKMSLKQEELVCLANAAENMRLNVDFHPEMNCIIVSKDD